MKKLLVLCLITCLTIPSIGLSQDKGIQTEKFNSLYETNQSIVKSKNFQFEGEWVFEDRDREELDAATNYLKIEKKNAEGQLISLSSKGSSVTLSDNIDNYNVDFDDKKQEISIQFRVENNTILIVIKPNGKAFLTLTGSSTKITQIGKITKL